MMRGLSLPALAKKIEYQRLQKRDYIAPTSKLSMELDADDDASIPVLEYSDHGRFPLQPYAHNQLSEKLGIPGKYYNRMMAENPELLRTNVNTWLRQREDKYMLRTLAGVGRAVLSNRYNRIENEEIAGVALPVLMGLPDYMVASAEVTDLRLYIQVVSPRVQGEVKKGDVVQAGVLISNSEVGYGAVTVAPIIYRLACLNGAVMPDSAFRAHHVGAKIADNEALWADDTRQADDRAILLKVRDMVRAAVDATAFSARLDKMKGLTEARIEGDPAEAVGVLAAKIGARDDERAGLLRALIEGADLSAWGLVNAVTAQAHTASSYDRAVELEQFGGKLIELPPTEWKKVLQAA